MPDSRPVPPSFAGQAGRPFRLRRLILPGLWGLFVALNVWGVVSNGSPILNSLMGIEDFSRPHVNRLGFAAESACAAERNRKPA